MDPALPQSPQLQIVIIGLSITSSWGNGHATTYRGLMRALSGRGHDVIFLERDTPWYRDHRDLPQPPFGRTFLYDSVAELRETWGRSLRDSDLIILGSYVPEGIEVGRIIQQTARGLIAFYDIDTPVTLAALAAGNCQYLSRDLIPGFDLYLSFTGGPVLRRIEQQLGARAAHPLYCGVDPQSHSPVVGAPDWDLGYLGTYSADRQPALERLMWAPARLWPEGRFAVAGSLYPDDLGWPENVERIEHIEPSGHATFFAGQRFTLNVTRADMIRWGYSPSVRLFEAAACGVPIITDWWAGLDEFFCPGKEILIARSTDEMLSHLQHLPEARRRELARNARSRILCCHTAEHRAATLASYIAEIRNGRERVGRFPGRRSEAMRRRPVTGLSLL